MTGKIFILFYQHWSKHMHVLVAITSTGIRTYNSWELEQIIYKESDTSNYHWIFSNYSFQLRSWKSIFMIFHPTKYLHQIYKTKSRKVKTYD